MPLLKNQEFVDDPWLDIEDEAPLVEGQPVIVSYDRLLGDESKALLEGQNPLGVRLRVDDPVEALEPWIGRLSLVTLNFPAFSDGRSFSAAAILREDLGFTGEIRAVGDVLVDQYQFMRRVGFDAFEIADGRSLESWRNAIVDVNLAYQFDPVESGIAPVWQARRAQLAQRLAAE